MAALAVDLLSGALAGINVTLVGHPFETIVRCRGGGADGAPDLPSSRAQLVAAP